MSKTTDTVALTARDDDHDVVVSVIVPTFNRADVIMESVRSVLCQDVSSLEVLVIDDGSSDNTQEVIQRMNASNVRYLRQDNAGASSARNAGIREARGRFIAFLDSDDRMMPHHLKTALEILETGDNVCVYTSVLVERGGVSFVKPRKSYDNVSPISEYLLCERGWVPTSGLVVPHSIAGQVMYDEALKFGDDIDYAVRLVANNARLKMLDKPGIVVDDLGRADRLSASIDPVERLAWIERMGPLITGRAATADRGWYVAKAMAQRGDLVGGLKLYFKALLSGAYGPRLALAVFLQVTLPPERYRKLADALAGLGARP